MAAKAYGTRAWTTPGYRFYAVIFAFTSLECVCQEGAAHRVQSLYALWVLVHAYATCRIFVFAFSKWNALSPENAYNFGATAGAKVCTMITLGPWASSLVFAATVFAFMWNTYPKLLQSTKTALLFASSDVRSDTNLLSTKGCSSSEVHPNISFNREALQERTRTVGNECTLQDETVSKETFRQPLLYYLCAFLLTSLSPFCYEVFTYTRQGTWLYLGLSRSTTWVNIHQRTLSVHVMFMFLWSALVVYQVFSKDFPSHRITGRIASFILAVGLLLGVRAGLDVTKPQLYCFSTTIFPLSEGQAIMGVFSLLILCEIVLLVAYARMKCVEHHMRHVKSVVAITSAVGFARVFHAACLIMASLFGSSPSLESSRSALFDFQVVVPTQIDALCFSVCCHLTSFLALLYTARQNSKTMDSSSAAGILSLIAAAVASVGATASLLTIAVTMRTVIFYGVSLSVIQSRWDCAQLS